MNHDFHETRILPFELPDEGSITRLYSHSLRLGRRMRRLAETILAEPDVDAATLDELVYTLDRGILAIDQLRTWAAEEQQDRRERRRAARFN
jgi:ATP:corrinoid adenosyltransferase